MEVIEKIRLRSVINENFGQGEMTRKRRKEKKDRLV